MEYPLAFQQYMVWDCQIVKCYVLNFDYLTTTKCGLLQEIEVEEVVQILL